MQRPGIRLAFAWVLVAVLGWARPAHALKLNFSLPADCDLRADITEDLERLLGRPLEEVSAEFEVVITPGARGGYDLRLTRPDSASSNGAARQLHADSCAEIGNATAVTIAMAVGVDPHAEASSSSTGSSAPPPEARAAEPGPRPPVVKPQAAPVVRAANPFVLVGVGALADAGALPKLAPGVQLDLGIGWRSLRAFAFGAVLATQRELVNDGRGGDFQLAFGGLAGCVERGINVILRGCAGFELGRLSGEGVGVSDPELGSTLWWGPRAELLVGLPVGEGLSVTAGLGAVLSLGKRSFVLDRADEVHEAAALDARGRLGVEFRP